MSADDKVTLDGLITVNTPSLREGQNAPVPGEIIRDLLRQDWQDSEAHPTPTIEVWNDVTLPQNVNLAKTDYVIVETGQISERQHGHDYEFIDVEVPIALDFHTVMNRQRLYNVMWEARRIIYKHRLSIRPYEVVYWDWFHEESEGKKNFWFGTASIRLTSRVVPIFDAANEQHRTPSLDPALAGVQ